MKILVTPTSFGKDVKSKEKDLLERFADEIIYNPFVRPLEADEIPHLLEGVDGYIAGLDFIKHDVILKAPMSLKVISRYGAGVDRVDVEAALEKGIVVTNTPGVNSQAVADLTLGLMLSTTRKIPMLDKRTKAGEWPRSTGGELYAKTIGIIGLGTIGRGVAIRAKGFSMNILAYDPYIDMDFVQSNNIRSVNLDEIFRESDFITLHIPLTGQTKGIIDEAAIGRMKDKAIIINTSRGSLIDETAAYEALKHGKLGGLGLDVFEREPPGKSPLFELDNVVATPHTGAHTAEAIENMGILAVQNLIDVLQGRECRYAVKML